MRFLLVNPPYVTAGEHILWPDAAMLPVGPLVIARLLEDRGHLVDVLDLTFGGDIPAEIDATHCDALLLACHTFRNINTTRQVLERVVGATHVVLGGNLCSELGCEDFAKLGLRVDAVVRGYGHDMINLIEARVRGDLSSPPSGHMPPPIVQRLDPTSLQRYLEISGGRYPIIGPGGLGCAWSCNYCAAKMNSRRVERRLEAIHAEIQEAKALGYREIWCVDNIVLADIDAALEFDRLIESLDLSWLGMTRAETVRAGRSQIRKFQRLTDIAIGVEAAPRALKSLNRGTRTNNNQIVKDAFRILDDAGISSTAFVMLDLPDSQDDDYWELLDVLTDIEPGNVSWSFYNPPAREMIRLGIDPGVTGFYRWPLGFANIPQHRVVQHAMVITGTWWMNWSVDSFIEDDARFGVAFDERQLDQSWSARSPIGDLWDVWKLEDPSPPITLEAAKLSRRQAVASTPT